MSTSSVFVDEVRKAPDIAKSDGVPETRENKLRRASPMTAFSVWMSPRRLGALRLLLNRVITCHLYHVTGAMHSQIHNESQNGFRHIASHNNAWGSQISGRADSAYTMHLYIWAMTTESDSPNKLSHVYNGMYTTNAVNTFGSCVRIWQILGQDWTLGSSCPPCPCSYAKTGKRPRF